MMKKYLSMLEGPRSSALAIDEKKLKFFNSKVSIWYHFSISENSYKSSSVRKKRARSIGIILSFIKNTTVQVTLFFVWCLLFLLKFGAGFIFS